MLWVQETFIFGYWPEPGLPARKLSPERAIMNHMPPGSVWQKYSLRVVFMVLKGEAAGMN